MKNYLVLALVLAACGGGKNVKSGGGDDTPAWVSQGTGAFTVESGKKLQGVGSAPRAEARARRTAADGAASGQLDAGLGALAAALTKMSESTKDNLGDEIARIARAAAAAAPHARDHWVGGDGSEAALDQLDLGAFKAALGAVDGEENLRREMANNADRAFDQLAKQ